jgi:hypothetical protein
LRWIQAFKTFDPTHTIYLGDSPCMAPISSAVW